MTTIVAVGARKRKYKIPSELRPSLVPGSTIFGSREAMLSTQPQIREPLMAIDKWVWDCRLYPQTNAAPVDGLTIHVIYYDEIFLELRKAIHKLNQANINMRIEEIELNEESGEMLPESDDLDRITLAFKDHDGAEYELFIIPL